MLFGADTESAENGVEKDTKMIMWKQQARTSKGDKERIKKRDKG